ncbi:MAG: hypothetical protein NZM42_10240 [Gemmatales bacterium]|nr:hypothetical protein [Gemmatales bacterium]
MSIPPGVLGRKRVQCPLCRGQFAVEVSRQSVKLLTGRAPGSTPLAPEAETPQRTRPLQPWEYRFDFAAIYGKTFSTYGTAFTASLF